MPKKKQWKTYVLLAFMIILIAIGGYFYNHYTTIKSILDAAKPQNSDIQPSIPQSNPLKALIEEDEEDEVESKDEKKEAKGNKEIVVIDSLNKNQQNSPILNSLSFLLKSLHLFRYC